MGITLKLCFQVGGNDDLGKPTNVIEKVDIVNDILAEIYVTEFFNNTCTTLLNKSLFVIGGHYTKKEHSETSNYALVLDFDGQSFHCSRTKCLAVEREKASKLII